MCGIAGEVGRYIGLQSSRYRVEQMVKSLSHRGPDEQSFWESQIMTEGGGKATLGMCRLSIIDREHGQQPFGDTCKTFFNGEIYNHKSLNRAMGLGCETRCDSEVIAKIYDLTVGYDCIRRLDGMFAIAIWDEQEKLLKLFRDRIGKKPLYYYHGDNVFLFASEIKAILTHPAYKKKINEAAIFQYLALQYVPEPDTAFEGIKQVPPGNWIIYNPESDEIAHGSYYEFVPPQVTKLKSTKEVEDAVIDAVYKRLESEVPLGVYLSGGIDSAIVTAIAAKRVKDLHTFTMGFLEPEYDETADAQIIADFWGTQHHVERVTSVNLANMAKQIVEQYDQPFGDCSAIPTILLAELSKKYITVALTGDGGDEAFGGYPRYWQCQDKIDRYWQWMNVIQPDMLQRIWSKRLMHFADPAFYINSWIYPGTSNGLMYCDMKTYLPNDIIVKMERATMLSSVEARCPFLDTKVLELGLSIPPEQKIGKESGKLILKEAFKDYLPDHIMGLKKRGFGVPMNKWLCQTEGVLLMSQTIMAKDSFGPLDGIDRQFVNIMISEHLSGKVSHGHRLWILIMLDMWLRRFF